MAHKVSEEVGKRFLDNRTNVRTFFMLISEKTEASQKAIGHWLIIKRAENLIVTEAIPGLKQGIQVRRKIPAHKIADKFFTDVTTATFIA